MTHKLVSVRRLRSPYHALARRIVRETLHAFQQPPVGPIIEIGAGDGQLRLLLPDEVAGRLVQTEKDHQLSLRLVKSSANPVISASAACLPFANASVPLVIGLCIMDVVEDADAVASEIARVLAVGGSFVHLLDMSTDLRAPLAEVAAAGPGLLLLPNVFTDPHTGSFPDDLFLVARDDVRECLHIAGGDSTEIALWLKDYLETVSRRPFLVEEAVATLAHVYEHPQRRVALRQLFRSGAARAPESERDRLRSFAGKPVSSGRHFQNRLEAAFSPRAGFVTELSEVRSIRERSSGLIDGGMAYRSLMVGHVQTSPTIPPHHFDADPGADADATGMTILEHGMFVFVARRDA